MSISTEINITKRNYFIQKVKGPLLKAIRVLAMRYLVPRRGELEWESSRRIFDAWQNIKKAHYNSSRNRDIDAAFIIAINENESDGYYAYLFYRVVLELKDLGFEDRGFPLWQYWNDLPEEMKAESIEEWQEKRMERRMEICRMLPLQ